MPTIASHSPLNIISKTIRDRGLVSNDNQYEMAHWESNDHVTYNVTWPWKVKVITPMLGPNISKTAGDAI